MGIISKDISATIPSTDNTGTSTSNSSIAQKKTIVSKNFNNNIRPTKDIRQNVFYFGDDIRLVMDKVGSLRFNVDESKITAFSKPHDLVAHFFKMLGRQSEIDNANAGFFSYDWKLVMDYVNQHFEVITSSHVHYLCFFVFVRAIIRSYGQHQADAGYELQQSLYIVLHYDEMDSMEDWALRYGIMLYSLPYPTSFRALQRPESDANILAHTFLYFYWTYQDEVHFTDSGNGRTNYFASMSADFDRGVDNYPMKNVPGAERIKPYASDIFKSIKAVDNAFASHIDQLYSKSLIGTHNDQVSGFLSYAFILYEAFNDFYVAVTYAYFALRSSKLVKNITTFIKSTGMNATRLGACMCEANCIRGKGNVQPDLYVDAVRRTGDEGACLGVTVDYKKLHAEVERIIHDELSVTALHTLPTLDEHIDKVWVSMKNGAHNWYVNNKYPHIYGSKDELMPAGIERLRPRTTRRVLNESLSVRAIKSWNGEVYATASNKAELDKDRPIYGCDTYSYVWFSHIFDHVEKHWQNKKAIIDPGNGGLLRMANRLKHQVCSGGKTVSIMADYEDFNSQHTNQSMKIVVGCVLDYLKVPKWHRDKLVDSFDKTYVVVDGKEVGKVTGSLMSGHRCTSFINTVLNVAYFNLAANEEGILYSGYHTGDDVVGIVANYSEAVRLLKRMKSMNFRLNPPKQCLSNSSCEFLRIAYSNWGTYCGYGYVARSIGSFIAGNWTSDVELTFDDYITSFISQTYTIINRSGKLRAGLVFAHTLMRLTGLSASLCREICSMKLGYNGQPMLSYTDYWTGLEKISLNNEMSYNFKRAAEVSQAHVMSDSSPKMIKNKKVKVNKDGIINHGKAYSSDMVQTPNDFKLGGVQLHQQASTRYLSSISDLERNILMKHNIAPLDKMLGSSYSMDTKIPQHDVNERVVVVKVALVAKKHGSFLHGISEKDPLARYPLLKLFEDYLDNDDYVALTGKERKPETVYGYNTVSHLGIPWSVVTSVNKTVFRHLMVGCACYLYV